VLFLPFKEIHEIGLLSVCYELKLLSKYVIYLGESIPVDDLVELSTKSEKICFIGYFTVYPDDENLFEYVRDFHSKILLNTQHQMWVGGYKAQFVRDFNLPKVNTFASISELLKNIS
jgi:hypothetical protein